MSHYPAPRVRLYGVYNRRMRRNTRPAAVPTPTSPTPSHTMASGTPGRASMDETGRPGLAGTPAACAVRAAGDGWAPGCRAVLDGEPVDGAPPVSRPAATGAVLSWPAAASPAAVPGVAAATLDPVPGSTAPGAGGTAAWAAAGADGDAAGAEPDAAPAPVDAAGGGTVAGAVLADDGEEDGEGVDDGAGVVGMGVRAAGDKGVPEVVGSGRSGSSADSGPPAETAADAVVPALSDASAVGSCGGTASSAKDAWTPVERTSTAPTAAAAVPRRSPPWIPVRDIGSSDLC
ncbi:hypothetical protein DFO47_102528 [Arthrobacter sp. AG258]|nr:hypothetical protein DFO47_102528 [Arthrobacter sp. AG258]